MGRIMMNGIQYGTGGRPTAEGVTYDNAESGMTATNVQGALDELSTDLTQSNSYSTSETVVGKWIDGKPIYRCVLTGFNFGGTTSAWTNTGATIQNVEHLIKCEGWISSTNIITMMGFRINGSAVQYWAANSWGGTDTIIAEYTKTTD